MFKNWKTARIHFLCSSEEDFWRKELVGSYIQYYTNYTILPHPCWCLHKMAPDSNKSGNAPWKPCEEKIRVMKMGKRMGKKIKLHKCTGRSQNAKERKLKVKKLSLFFLGFWFFRFLNRNFVKFSELLFFAFHVILPLYLVSKDFYATISKFLTLHITCVVHSKECYLVFTKSLIVEIDRFRALKEINLILFGGVRHHNTKLNPSVCGILSVSYYFNLCVKK